MNSFRNNQDCTMLDLAIQTTSRVIRALAVMNIALRNQYACARYNNTNLNFFY